MWVNFLSPQWIIPRKAAKLIDLWPFTWDVKNLSSFEKEIVPISLNPYFLEAPSYVTRMQTAEIKHLAFCYFLGDVATYIVGLSSQNDLLTTPLFPY